MGNYAQVEPLLARVLRIQEKALGLEHPRLETTLNLLASAYYRLGNHKQAEPILQRLLRIRERRLGPEHLGTAEILNNLALVIMERGGFSQAESLLKRALAIYEKHFGLAHKSISTTLNNLALVYLELGDNAQAGPILRRAIRIDNELFGPDNLAAAFSLHKLASLHLAIGDYAEAELLFRRAISIRESKLGVDHPSIANSLEQLANLYHEIGNRTRAESIYLRVLKIRETKLGLEHGDTARSIQNLAQVYADTDFAKAEGLYLKALAICEKKLGPNHLDVALILSSVALLYKSNGAHERAEQLFQRAMRIYRNILPHDHLKIGTCLNNLAVLYTSIGDHMKAMHFFQQSLRIAEKRLGPEHQDMAALLDNITMLYIDLRQDEEALSCGIRSAHARDKVLSNVLSFSSEQQRLAYHTEVDHQLSVFATMGSAPHVAQAVLRHKGIVLDSLLEDLKWARTANEPGMERVVLELRSLRSQLRKITIEVPQDVSDQGVLRLAERRALLEKQVEELEGLAARRVANLGRTRRSLSMTPSLVQAVLSQDSVLVEYLRYEHYLGRGKFESRYGAVVLPPSGAPSWVSLGGAKPIEELVQRYRVELRSSQTTREQEGRLAGILRDLNNQIWEPVKPHLPQAANRVILSPDGALNFVAFATLLEPDKSFLAEHYRTYYVASGRDLLKTTDDPESTSVAVFADPAFSSTTLANIPHGANQDTNFRLASAANLLDLAFPRLEGSAAEATTIAELGRKAGWQTAIYTQGSATKTQLVALPSPRILHIATHGFFLPVDNETTRSRSTPPNGFLGIDTTPMKRSKNPMYYSGLALAGAQVTVDAWRHGEVVPADRDGILTSAEISQLDLNATQLVVLSACDTGMGSIVVGEGVLGMRRAFVQAGARNLLLTLWPVQDRSTAAFMKDFYQHLAGGTAPPDALARTQRDWLIRVRQQSGLRQAVVEAGPFVMSIQGKP